MNEQKDFRVAFGDTITDFVSSKQYLSFADVSRKSLSEWYEEDTTKNHLGLMKIINNREKIKLPFYEDLFNKRAVIEVASPDSRLSYDIEVEQSYTPMVAVSTDHLYTEPGKDNGVFKLILDTKFLPGDILAPQLGSEHSVMVDSAYDVVKEGNNYVHYVKYMAYNKKSYFPRQYLQAGTPFTKSAQSIGGEYGRDYSAPMASTKRSTLRMYFHLANHMGVESNITMYANRSLGMATLETRSKMNYFMRQLEDLGVDAAGNPIDLFMMADFEKNKNGTYKLNEVGQKVIDKNSVRISSALEYMVLAELRKIEAYQLIFHPGGEVVDNHGVRRTNAGIYHQLKRGQKYLYNRPGGFTLSNLKELVEYVYKNAQNVNPNERKIIIKAGSVLFENLSDIINKYVSTHTSQLAPLVGTQALLPKSPVSGPNLQSLHMDYINFNSIRLPGVGEVQIQHEPSLDTVPANNFNDQGLVGRGFSESACRGIVQVSDNANWKKTTWQLGKEGRIMDDKAPVADIYYVKLAGRSLFWGNETGRWHPTAVGSINSSHRQLSACTYAHIVSAALIPDPSKFLIIECISK